MEPTFLDVREYSAPLGDRRLAGTHVNALHYKSEGKRYHAYSHTSTKTQNVHLV